MAEPTRDIDLVRLYWPVDVRPAFDALLAIDAALADVVRGSTQPALGVIRLAWWREALERLDVAAPPAEPRLQAAALHLLPAGVSGVMLAALEDGYAAMLDEEIDAERVAAGGEVLFRAAARLLKADDSLLGRAGRIHAFASAARLGLMAIPAETGLGDLAGHRFKSRLRPLTGLARLAGRDLRNAPELEPEATPARALALLKHRISGTVS